MSAFGRQCVLLAVFVALFGFWFVSQMRTPEVAVPVSVPLRDLTDEEKQALDAEVEQEMQAAFMAIFSNRLDQTLPVLVRVENPAGDVNAVGDKHLTNRAYGLYQIRQPYLDDVNRLVGREAMFRLWGKQSLTIEDVKNPEVSQWVARKYLEHYGKVYMQHTGHIPTIEVYARMHNGGPNGWRKSSTNAYMAKVLRIMKQKVTNEKDAQTAVRR